MAQSKVYFRMFHGNASEPVAFTGNGIKVIDLKKEILSVKNISGSLDFDLKITDSTGKVYAEDDDTVPKNATLVVKRVPAKSSHMSLIARLQRRSGGGHHHNHHSSVANATQKADILMPMRPDDEEGKPLRAVEDGGTATDSAVTNDNAVQQGDGSEAEDVLKMLEEEDETELKPTASALAGVAPEDSGVGTAGAGRGVVRPPAGGAGRGAGAYPCARCGRMGHNAKYCSTIGDPKYDPAIYLQNIPKAVRKRVSSLEGIDTAHKTIVQHSDGTYEIFETSTGGGQLARDAKIQLSSNIDMGTVPDHLKCALSEKFLTEAVQTPCCSKDVNDSAIRQALLKSGLKCPLCSTANVSPDALVTRYELRDEVDRYIKMVTAAAEGSEEAQPFVVPEEEPSVQPTAPNSGVAPPMPPVGIPTTDATNSGAPGPIYNAMQMQQPPRPPMPPSIGGVPPIPMMPWNAQMMNPMGYPMGQGFGMMGPGSFDEIPPLEVLPVPLTREEFLKEQQIQRELRDKGISLDHVPRSNRRGNRGRGGSRIDNHDTYSSGRVRNGGTGHYGPPPPGRTGPWRGRGDSRDRGRGNSRDRGRGNSRDRGRGNSRDRGRGDSRDRGRGYSRDRGRGNSRDRGRGNSRDRGRGNSRDRGRGDSRDRGRGNSQDRNRQRRDSKERGVERDRDIERVREKERMRDSRAYSPARRRDVSGRDRENRSDAEPRNRPRSRSPRRRSRSRSKDRAKDARENRDKERDRRSGRVEENISRKRSDEREKIRSAAATTSDKGDGRSKESTVVEDGATKAETGNNSSSGTKRKKEEASASGDKKVSRQVVMVDQEDKNRDEERSKKRSRREEESNSNRERDKEKDRDRERRKGGKERDREREKSKNKSGGDRDKEKDSKEKERDRDRDHNKREKDRRSDRDRRN